MKNFSCAFILCFLELIVLSGEAHAQTPCNLYGPGSQVPVGFGVPYNTLSSAQELMVSVACTNSNATLTVGNGSNLTYVYNQGYRWDGANWRQLTLAGRNLISNAWFVGVGNATLSLPSSQLAQNDFIVGYACQWTGTSWKCGCRDGACATPAWQLQAFTYVTTGDGSSAGSGSGSSSGGPSNGVLPGYAKRFYGNPYMMYSLGNTTISPKKTGGTAYSNRVIFPFSGNVVGVRKYHIWRDTPSGYHLGDGGLVEYHMETDDGTRNHFPSGKILSRTGNIIGIPPKYTGRQSGVIDTPYSGDDDNFRRIDFKQSVSVTAGEIYHLTVHNTSPNPSVDAVGMNDLLVQDPNNRADVFDPLNLRVLYKNPSGTWVDRGGRHHAIVEFYFDDGSVWGNGNIAIANPNTSRGYRLDGSRKVRERFTVTGGDKKAKRLRFAATREKGSAGIHAIISGPSGQLFSGTIAANNYPVGGTQEILSSEAGWGSIDLGQGVLLEQGKEYTVEFSTAVGTSYGVTGTRDGSQSYNFGKATTFSDGIAEVYERSGWHGWINWTQKPTDEYDLIMYFELD